MFNLTLSPAQTEYIVKPGGNIVHSLTVTNNSNQNLVLTTSVRPWVPGTAEGAIDYRHAIPDPNIIFYLSNPDLKLGQAFNLPAYSKKQLVINAAVSQKSDQKDAYFTFFVSQDISTLDPNRTSQSLAEIGAHLLLAISHTQELPSQAQIGEFQIRPIIKDSLLTPIVFQAKIQNRSDHYFRSQGKITLTKNKKIIQTLDLFPETVLAHQQRSIRCHQPSLPAQSSPQPQTCRLSPPLWPGIYTATLALDSSLNGSSAAITFAVLPFSVFIPLLLAALAIIFTPRFLTRRRRLSP